jgi:hypothetical protein
MTAAHVDETGVEDVAGGDGGNTRATGLDAALDDDSDVTLALVADDGAVDEDDLDPAADAVRRADHLDREPRPQAAVAATAPREAWCDECARRVTVDPDGIREYGHGSDCSHAYRPGGDGR